jgi:hypothetical protein
MTEPSIAILTPLPTRYDNLTERQLHHYLQGINRQNKPNLHFYFTCHTPLKPQYQHILEINLAYPFTVITLEPTQTDKTIQKATDLALHRNELLKHAQPFNYALFLDSDIELQENAIENLLCSGRDLTAGVVVVPIGLQTSKDSEVEQLAVGYGNFVFINNQVANLNFTSSLSPTLTEAGFACSACLCLNQKTINDNRLKFEAFQIRGKGILLCEDIGYCYNAARLGYKVWVNPSVQCLHHRRGANELHHLWLRSGNMLHLNFGAKIEKLTDSEKTDKSEESAKRQ